MGCITVAERMPSDQRVMDSYPARRWAFPLLFLSISLSLRSVSFNRSFEELVGCNTTDFPVKR